LALQELDFSLLNVADVSAAAALRYGFPADEISAIVRQALETEPVREAAASPFVVREVYAASLLPDVGLPDGELPGVGLPGVEAGLLLEGILDLVYERGDGTLGIVDYKTDRVSGTLAARERVEERYGAQGRAYVDLVTRATGRAVTRTSFVFLRPSPAVVVDL